MKLERYDDVLKDCETALKVREGGREGGGRGRGREGEEHLYFTLLFITYSLMKSV